MDVLFKHVEGNRFKLNEDIDKSINKMEENVGLNYIRKLLIPLAVNSWNKAWLRSKTIKRYTVTRELISKNLKKVTHANFSKDDKTTTDVIRYESNFLLTGDIKLKEPFLFELHKHIQTGRLIASFMIPGGSYHNYFVGDTIDEDVVTENDEEVKNSKYVISKIEEMESLQYIRNILVPRAADLWNNKLSIPLHWQVTPKTISQSLKKTKHRIGSKYKTDFIYYMSVVKLGGQKRNHHFKFITYKYDGKLESAFDVGAYGIGYYTIDSNNQLKHIPPIQ